MKKYHVHYLAIVWIAILSCSQSEAVQAGRIPLRKNRARLMNRNRSLQTGNESFFWQQSHGWIRDYADEAFPALVQEKIDSLQLPYTVVNAGLGGETSSGGLGRID
jgi:acyl-CoA thioesterase-1